MPIFNYSTTVAAEKTAGEIQHILSRAGASAIMMEFSDDQVLSSIAFRIKYKGQELSFRLPAKIDNVYVILQNDLKVPRRYCTREQAARICWRTTKDWIKAQMAIIEADQAEMTEIFLPFLQDTATGQTVYEKLAANNFKSLGYDNDG